MATSQRAQSRNQSIYQFCFNGSKTIFLMKIHTLVYAKMPNMAILCESRRGPCKAPTLCLFQNRKGKNPHSDLYLEKEECPGSKLQSYQKIPQFPRDVDSFIPLLCTSVLDLCQKYLYLEIFWEKSHF